VGSKLGPDLHVPTIPAPIAAIAWGN